MGSACHEDKKTNICFLCGRAVRSAFEDSCVNLAFRLLALGVTSPLGLASSLTSASAEEQN